VDDIAECLNSKFVHVLTGQNKSKFSGHADVVGFGTKAGRRYLSPNDEENADTSFKMEPTKTTTNKGQYKYNFEFDEDMIPF
jgi:hypothetical protein